MSVVYFFTTGIIRLLRMQRICDGTFERLVMLGERTVGHAGQGYEQPADAFRIHDERTHVILGRRVGLEIRHVVADPALLRFVPPYLPPVVIPRLAVHVARRAVVHHAAVHRPGPAPVGINAEPRRIVRAAALHQRAGLGPGTAVQPIAGSGRAVVAQEREARQLLPGLDCYLLRGRIGNVRERPAVQLLGDFRERRIIGIGISPGQIQDRIRKLSAFFFVKIANAQEKCARGSPDRA